jgi:4-hydroxy-tetrahydrodipicolinate reductase
MAIKVVVTGACGKMGQEVVRTIRGQADMELGGALEKELHVGSDIGRIAAGEDYGVMVSNNLDSILKDGGIGCLVDFTRGSESPDLIRTALSHRVPAVVGTTGIKSEELEEIGKLAEEVKIPVLVVPNFCIGAVLMMKFAIMASKYFNHAEIIELHHDKKLDAPSGTALRTAELMAGSGQAFLPCQVSQEKIDHVRGGVHQGIHLHSVRLPGLLAHQEVIFGSEGEVLTLRHDSMARASFMPGVMYAIRNIQRVSGLAVGLEEIMEL